MLADRVARDARVNRAGRTRDTSTPKGPSTVSALPGDIRLLVDLLFDFEIVRFVKSTFLTGDPFFLLDLFVVTLISLVLTAADDCRRSVVALSLTGVLALLRVVLVLFLNTVTGSCNGTPTAAATFLLLVVVAAVLSLGTSTTSLSLVRSSTILEAARPLVFF